MKGKTLLILAVTLILVLTVSISASPSWSPELEGNIDYLYLTGLCFGNQWIKGSLHVFSHDLILGLEGKYITFNSDECHEITENSEIDSFYGRMKFVKISYERTCSRDSTDWTFGVGDTFTIYSDKKSCLKGNHHKYKKI